MNDRAVNVLEKYELDVERTWKGRGSILFETGEGIFILKEYKGTPQRLPAIAGILEQIRENGYTDVETILPDKEGEYLVRDHDGTGYIVKTYFQGKECNICDRAEYLKGIKSLAKLHHAMDHNGIRSMEEGGLTIPDEMPVWRDFKKHTAELRGVRRYLRAKSQKSDFELYLQKHYDPFLEQAVKVQESLQSENLPAWHEELKKKHQVCHGDYQYHNILMGNENCCIINFEKMAVDSPVRDLYLFMRKLLEKTNWNVDIGRELLHTYNKERTLREEELLQLKYRLSYPEKFWKIVNYYYNSSKSWIPGKNGEKLSRLLEQEEAKTVFLQKLFP